ncbi:hypothetical protein BGAFAR04_0338 [Borreliella garinii Far04]|uniref:Uncharacterized protein n=1 Tax=Borreliella garinii PBr TaxID=498743 RepID=B7XSZ4_BORGR|nr:hypothetical protein BGAPBR_0327 [Borreliella garinii PBr]EED29832.1 hypothetical protein BGAFAR04_0338 [Borreliella garinii Far04]
MLSCFISNKIKNKNILKETENEKTSIIKLNTHFMLYN